MKLIRYSYPAFRTAVPSFGGFQRSPWTGLETEIDRLFESARAELGATVAPNRFPVDLYEDKTNTYVRAELPGVSRDEITVELTDGCLTIAVARRAPEVSSGSGQTSGDSFSVSRCLSVADNIDTDKIAALYENGVLTVTLPKREEVAPKKVTIAIK